MAAAPIAGDVIRVISANGLAIESFEVGTGSTTTVINIRAPLNGFSTNYPTANQYTGGRLWIYKGTGATAGQATTTGASSYTVTGDDVDGSGYIYVDAINPNF